jgi:DNA polymerase-3 subunit delta'
MPPLPDKIIGHEKQCALLLKDIASGNVAHAYLFSGPKHLGKFTIARWFALQLLSDGVPAEERADIQDTIERLIHPDFLSLDMLWIEGVSEDWNVIGETSNISQLHRSKAPTAKTDVISIEDVRLLSERLYSTGSSKYYCCLIRSVERMQDAAANALLKILEEPPSRTVFILTTEAVSSLLPTLVSRTRVMHFRPLPKATLRELVAEGDDESLFAMHLSQGAPGKLLSLLADPDSLRESRQLHTQAKRFWQTTSLKERLTWLMPFIDEKGAQPDLLLHLGLALREHPDARQKVSYTRAYAALARGLKTNAHRGLVLQQFALAAGRN